MSSPVGQIPLPILPRPEARFETFVAGPNAVAAAAVRAAVATDGEPYLFLFGPPGTGKSHLLHAACHARVERGGTAAYLPLGEDRLVPAVLEGLEHVELVALDDVERIAGDPDWERDLFGLYNRLREAGRTLLVSADRPAGDLPLGLADLRSRLGWGPAFQLQPLTDRDCAALLRAAARTRGLDLGEPAIAYIMRRSPRDPRGLLAVLDALDQASLREKRRPTVPLIRTLFDDLERRN
ncbi:DnaA regulatory inactivator Hda [Thiococcus pfennigii]|uniref:DnaA regulatory inactivator Hda n=1 Tax=Thiococcus pfennigii TaxID=1057 RepID=UPI0030B90E97